jgi:phage shock protein PspC (stress-responsive transcriptional regulator)
MNESTDTTQQPGQPGGPDSEPSGGGAPPPTPPLRPPLRRSVADRKIAGVAGGLGRYFNIDPLIFRVVLVTLAIFGGSGLLLYAIGWLLIPEDGEDESEASRLINGRATAKIVGAVILAIVGLIAVGNFAQTGFGFGGFAALLAIGAAAYLISRGDMGWRPNQQPAPTAPATQGQSGPASHPPAPYSPAPYGPPAPGAYGQTPGTAYAAGPVAAAGTTPPAPPTWNAPPTWTPPPPRPREPRSPLGRVTVSIAALAAAALVSWNIATVHDVPAEVVIASCLGIVALGLIVGAFVGRARGLIALGIILAVAASIAGVTSDINFHGGAGERRWAPQTVAAVEAHGPYRLGIGSSELDLSNLDIPAGGTLGVDVRQGIGDLTVILPAGVAVEAAAEVHVGALRVLSAPRESGTDMHVRVADPDGASPLIVLNTDLGVGEVEVRRATS